MRKKMRYSKPGGDLADAMIQIRDEVAESTDATEKLRRCIISMGAATEDNLNCVKHVEIGQIRTTGGPVLDRGVKIKGKSILLSDITGYIEGAPIPEEVREGLPRLTVAEWRACLRFVTLLLSSLEKGTWEVDDRR
jgi:hypothetical protein